MPPPVFPALLALAPVLTAPRVAHSASLDIIPLSLGYFSSSLLFFLGLTKPSTTFFPCQQPCTFASPGYFVSGVAATAQIACGANTQTNEGRTSCVTDCTFIPPISGIKNFKYDLNPLYNPDIMNYAGTDQ